MEDNINFNTSVPERLDIYQEQLPKDWSVVFDNSTYRFKDSPVKEGQYVYLKSNKIGSTRGACCYLINLETATLLDKYFLPFGNVVDHWYNYLFKVLNIKSYHGEPSFVDVAHHISTSQLN
jgi:hypothetical protein